MAIKTYKPITPGQRFKIGYVFDEITKTKPERSLITTLKKKGGRNFRGTVTVRHHGGGAKQMLRAIDFKRDKFGVAGKVAAIEYDPNRTARIALIHYIDGEKRYILAPQGLTVGDQVMAGEGAEVKPGNALPLKSIPVGSLVHNLELHAGKGGQLVRTAGGGAQILAREDPYVLVRMPSGEVRRFQAVNYATVGQLGNVDHKNITFGKAGRKRYLGKKPHVRGSAMTPRDHPHGGGEGRSPVGHPGPLSPWGRPTLGFRTRNNKVTDKWIVRRRTTGR